MEKIFLELLFFICLVLSNISVAQDIHLDLHSGIISAGA